MTPIVFNVVASFCGSLLYSSGRTLFERVYKHLQNLTMCICAFVIVFVIVFEIHLVAHSLKGFANTCKTLVKCSSSVCINKLKLWCGALFEWNADEQICTQSFCSASCKCTVFFY